MVPPVAIFASHHASTQPQAHHLAADEVYHLQPHGVATVTDAERLAKLEQAVALIREVEFSYPYGSDVASKLGLPLVFLGCITVQLHRLSGPTDRPLQAKAGNTTMNRLWCCIYWLWVLLMVFALLQRFVAWI